MKAHSPLFALTLAAAFAGAALAQQSAKPADELPDAPQATGAALMRPNGPRVVMDTSMGRITCQFFQQQAPKAVANFIGLAEGTKDWTDPATQLLAKTWGPSLSVTGMEGVPPGELAGNVLRPWTSITMSFRLPPTVDPDVAADALVRTLEADPPHGATVKLDVRSAEAGWDAPPTAPWLR